MGCVSSKILARSGSLQEKVSSFQFQRSSAAIEDIILSTSKSNGGAGDQLLALLRTTSTSSARKAKDPAAEPPAVAEPAARIETIDVFELLAGLEEDGCCTAPEQARERRESSRGEGGGGAQAPWSVSAGRARSFRTVEEFDAMVLTQQRTQTQSGSSSSGRRVAAPATEEDELSTATAASAAAAATTAEAEVAGRPEAATAGAKRRARARQLGELNVPAAAGAAAFDFSKSGSLRDWLRQGGQIFSPGSYVTPRFGTAPATPPTAERGGAAAAAGGGDQHHQQQAVFDPELVAQLERAMEQLSEDEGRALDEILEALELEAAEKKDSAAAVVGKVGCGDQRPPEPVLLRQV